MNDKIKTILSGIEGLIDRLPDETSFYSLGQRRAYELVKELIYQQSPELQESEDEKIRKEIIGYLNNRVATAEEIEILYFKRWIAYLEKQKEQKPKVECDIAQPVEQAGTAEPDYGICSDSVPGKLSAALRRHGWYLGHVGEDQQLVEARKIEARNEEFIRNWPFDRCSMTQEENLIMANSPQLEEQKPAEWSEEDKQHKSWILECLADGERKTPEYAEDFRAAYNWLKSLRPQPHWKPSEEQMAALMDALRVSLSEPDMRIPYDPLSALYEQLKKL